MSSRLPEGFLKECAGLEDRITEDTLERYLYGHDIGAMPKPIGLVTGKTLPDAIVQPKDTEELVHTIKTAAKFGIPLTPRGKATSGYGGAVPIKKGIVLDMRRLYAVEKIDTQGETVTVQPGITWEMLDKKLLKEGYTLRLYPTSYPSATVGGWLAQGGAGLGSYQFGWFIENVVSATIIDPAGRSREVRGDDLSLVDSAEGITGIISSVELKIRKALPETVRAVTCLNEKTLQNFLHQIHEQELPIWSVLFINPTMAQMKVRANKMARDEDPHPHSESPYTNDEIPPAYIVTITFGERNASVVDSALRNIENKGGICILPQQLADHEWENRFKIMQIKRLGPSFVPSEVVLPLNAVGEYLSDVKKKVVQPVLKEGVIIRNGKTGAYEVALLGFIPADERSFTYSLVFGLAMSLIRLAEKHGGRAYTTGMYFSTKAKSIMGADTVRRLKKYKKEIDPRGILNPGKVLGHSIFDPLMAISFASEPLIRLAGNLTPLTTGKKSVLTKKGIPPDVAYYAYACSQCGYCVDTCDQFYGRGWESQNPRGKWYWIRLFLEGKIPWSQKMTDTIISCTTCEMCNRRCSEDLPIESSWMKLRGSLIQDQKKMTFPPFEMMAAALNDQGNIWAGYRKNRTDWFPEELKEKHGPGTKGKYVYFAGCTSSYIETDIAIATAKLLHKADVDFTYCGEKENCCATPMLVAGKWDLFAETMKKNIAAVKETGADTIIASCPACDMMWRHVYPKWAKKIGIDFDIKTKHYSEVISEKIREGSFTFPENGKEKEIVTWHDSCHAGRVSGIYEPPRDMIKAVPGAEFKEMEHNRDESLCCGSVLTLIKEPPVAAIIGKARLDEAVEIGAKKCIAICPCCEVQLRVSAKRKNIDIEIVDLAHYVGEACGFELPDPNPQVHYQWGVFEQMIALMTPGGFAALMSKMWPELIDAMPFGMGPMMRTMGKIPGALPMMKPMFPVLFPRLLPMMMPKVLPKMLTLINEQIDMPDYMAEQMPQMLPKVMDNLMPHMIGDVVPLVTDSMIAYLEGKK